MAVVSARILSGHFQHLSPSLVLGQKLRELLACLTHANPVRRKRPIMSLLLGLAIVKLSELLSGSFFLILWTKSVLGCQQISQKVPHKVPPGSPSFSKFTGSWVVWAARRLGGRFNHARFHKVPPNFHHSSTKVFTKVGSAKCS